MKIALDSTILVRAFTDSGGLARVLRYPRMRARHEMSESRIYDYAMFLQSVATMVRPDPTLVAPTRDPNDIVVLQTAIIGGAEAVLVQPEMERGRSPQVSIPPCGRGFSRHAGLTIR